MRIDALTRQIEDAKNDVAKAREQAVLATDQVVEPRGKLGVASG